MQIAAGNSGLDPIMSRLPPRKSAFSSGTHTINGKSTRDTNRIFTLLCTEECFACRFTRVERLAHKKHKFRQCYHSLKVVVGSGGEHVMTNHLNYLEENKTPSTVADFLAPIQTIRLCRTHFQGWPKETVGPQVPKPNLLLITKLLHSSRSVAVFCL